MIYDLVRKKLIAILEYASKDFSYPFAFVYSIYSKDIIELAFVVVSFTSVQNMKACIVCYKRGLPVILTRKVFEVRIKPIWVCDTEGTW